jgi:diguanylate cyclase (GGDEF)-like protein
MNEPVITASNAFISQLLLAMAVAGAADFQEVQKEITAANERAEAAETRAEALAKLAYRDPLTDLLNERGCNEEATRLVHEILRENFDKKKTRLAVAVLAFDVDKFKTVNDNCGHEGGDKALVLIAEQTRKIFRRPTDILVRLHGDEFLILYVAPTHKIKRIAEIRAEMLRSSIEKNCMVEGKRCRFEKVSVSIGGAFFMLNKSLGSPEAVVETIKKSKSEADAALYKAKEDGRNIVCISDAGLPEIYSAENSDQTIGFNPDRSRRDIARRRRTAHPVKFANGSKRPRPSTAPKRHDALICE